MQHVAERDDRQAEQEIDDLRLAHVVFVGHAGQLDERDQRGYRHEDRMQQRAVDPAAQLHRAQIDAYGQRQQKNLRIDDLVHRFSSRLRLDSSFCSTRPTAAITSTVLTSEATMMAVM